MAKGKETTGDVIRINITPKSTTFPWIHIFRYPKGVRGGSAVKISSLDAKHGKRADLALDLGEAIIKASKVLDKEFPR